MKVLCVDGVKRGEPSYDTANPASMFDEIYEGEIYTVVMEKEYHGKLCYFLAERRQNAAYYSGCFVPLSTIDETELLKERESNLINI